MRLRPKTALSPVTGIAGDACHGAAVYFVCMHAENLIFVKKMLAECEADTLKNFSFMDLDEELVNRQLERERLTRKTGPLPEAVVRDAAMRQ